MQARQGSARALQVCTRGGKQQATFAVCYANCYLSSPGSEAFLTSYQRCFCTQLSRECSKLKYTLAYMQRAPQPELWKAQGRVYHPAPSTDVTHSPSGSRWARVHATSRRGSAGPVLTCPPGSDAGSHPAGCRRGCPRGRMGSAAAAARWGRRHPRPCRTSTSSPRRRAPRRLSRSS